MFIPLKKILPLKINQWGLKKKVEATRVCQIWEEAVENIFKSRAANVSRALYFKNKTLTVSVPNSVWANEFQLYSSRIIREINQKLGKSLVERINFKIEN